MRQTPLQRKTPMKRTKGINRVSVRKVREMQGETPIRIALCQRAYGTPMLGKNTYCIKGVYYPVTTVKCAYGICENCGQRCEYLEPHEKKHRSLGGRLSLENTIMVCRPCHRILQNNEPIWSKEKE